MCLSALKMFSTAGTGMERTTRMRSRTTITLDIKRRHEFQGKVKIKFQGGGGEKVGPTSLDLNFLIQFLFFF